LRTERELEVLLSISERPDGWTPPIIKTVATENGGTAALAAAIAGYQQFLEADRDRSNGRRATTAEHRIVELLRDRLLKAVMNKVISDDELQEMSRAVADHSRDPYSVVDEIMVRLGISP
jgi:LAO/AO transport system kinase